MPEHPIVKEHLHVVVFFLKTAIAVRCLSLYVPVGSRLLLHKQPEIGRHQVYPTLYAQRLAHKRRLQHGLATVKWTLVSKQLVGHLHYIARLACCRYSELFLHIEVAA